MSQLNCIARIQEIPLENNEAVNILRFITCGSVDDGKSTLIGRLLYDSKLIFQDQLDALVEDSKKLGRVENEVDLSLLVDGLEAERAQGITIDVAYRFFSTTKRKFIVADTPGHEQYTRNMATGASTADLAIVILDARKGILTQTRRHSAIVSMLGVKNVILAINKIDLIDYDEILCKRIEEDFRLLAKTLQIENIQCIPISALHGDNIVLKSRHTTWYTGPCLLEYLESVSITNHAGLNSFCLPVQLINRSNMDFRGYCGTISSGSISIGDKIKILPSGKLSTVSQIITYQGLLEKASKGQAVTLTLKDEIDISRGDVLVSPEDSCSSANQFQTNILWMSEKAMVPSRQYIIQAHTTSAVCTLIKPKHRIDVDTFAPIATKALSLNEFGICDIIINKAIAFDPYSSNRELGSFILVDRTSNETVAAGMIIHGLRRSTNIHLQTLKINQDTRALIKGQKPCVIWLTGFSGAGKTTIANMLEEKLYEMGNHTILLDGDNIRLGINRDLGFTEQDRAENIRRVSEISKLMMEAGLITITSFISPFKTERDAAKELIGEMQFIEVFVDAPLEVAESRDVKGLYKKARKGEIPNFTGIGSPYEPPETPDIHLDTLNHSPEDLVNLIINFLYQRGFLL